MTTAADTKPESRPFEADVARLLHLMVHSVYSDKDVFLRELISNAADAAERLRYEAIATPALLDEDAKARITIKLDPDAKTLTVEDNGIGMSRDEMVEALGTIARSGTKAFMDVIFTAMMFAWIRRADDREKLGGVLMKLPGHDNLPCCIEVGLPASTIEVRNVTA